jgi:hypothetical protein
MNNTKVEVSAPAALRVAVAPAAVPLKDNTLETLVEWRNAASQRIDEADKVLMQIESAYMKLSNKRASDARWARKLNKLIIKKALRERPHRVV